MRRNSINPIFAACLIAASMLAFAACGGSSKTSATASVAGFPMTLTRCGHTLKFDRPPSRILVKEYEGETIVGPAGGNMTGKIVAVADTNSDGVNPADPGLASMANVPVISPGSDITKETIVGQKPDLVIAHSFDKSPQDQLDTLGVQSMIVNVCCDGYALAHGGHGSFNEIYDDVALIGKLLGTETYAANSVAQMKATVAAVSARAPSLRAHLAKPTAGFAYLYNGGFYTYGPASIADAQIKALGLTNAFADLTKRGTQLSAEEFIARDPGVVVVATGFMPGETNAQVMQRILAIPGINKMTAVRQHHIVVIPGSYILSRAIDGLKFVADQIATFK